MRNIVLAAFAATVLMSGAAFANIAHGVQGGPPQASVLLLGNGAQGDGSVAGQQTTPEQRNLQGNGEGSTLDGNSSGAQE